MPEPPEAVQRPKRVARARFVASGAVLAVVLAATGACGSSSDAPGGAVADCGTITYRGGHAADGAASARVAAQCFVTAVHACHAAHLRLNFMGVDTGTTDVLTVRRAEHRACATSVAATAHVLGRSNTHRHRCAALLLSSQTAWTCPTVARQ